jgi:hypothetical protein
MELVKFIQANIYLSKYFYLKWSKTRRYFIATAFKFSFRIFHYEGLGKLGGTEI